MKAHAVQPLSFALDFDDTFTAAPGFFSRMVEAAKMLGHRFTCVTARGESEENVDEINAAFDHWGCQMPIVFTNRRSKLDVMQELGIKVDVWIDDQPRVVVNGAI